MDATVDGNAMMNPATSGVRARLARLMPPGCDLIRTRDFGLLFWGQLTSQIGDSLSKVALLWFVYQLTGSALKMAIIGLLQTVPPLVLGPLVGVYLDRVSKKATMVAVDLVRTVLVALIPALYALDALTLEGLYCLVFLNAIVSMIFGPALASSVPLIVSRTHLTSANAWLQGTANVGVLIGPILSGIGIATIGAQNVLYLDAATFLVSALCLIPMRVKEPDWSAQTEVARGSFFHELSIGFRFVFLRDRTIFTLMLTATLYSLGVSAFVFMLPVFAERTLDVGPLELGWLWSGLGVGMLATSAWLATKGHRDLFKRFRMIAAAMAIGGLAVCWLSTMQTPLFACMLIVVIGACTAVFMPVAWGVLQELTPEPLMGRVFTTFSTGGMASSMAGMAGFGWAADTMGPSVSLIGIGLVLLGTALFAARVSRASLAAR